MWRWSRKFLAETARRRSERDRTQHHARWHAAHHCWRVAEHARAWFGANPIVGEVWTTKPFQLPGFTYERMMRGTSFLRVIGRMKPGITLEQVRAALPSLDQDYRAHYATKIDSTPRPVKTLPQDVTENFRAGFVTLFAAVCFVLLIACSNVANLLLVRFSGRRREIALRMAIGASRTGIVRLFVFESLLVSVFAGASARSWRGGLCRWFRKWRPIFFRSRETPPAAFRLRCSLSRLDCRF